MVIQHPQGPLGMDGVFQAVGNPTFVLDPACTVMDVNQVAVDALGVPADEMRGKKCCDLFRGQDCDSKGCPVQGMPVSEPYVTAEARFEGLDKAFLLSCTPIRDESGNLQRILLVAIDITKIKETEEALRKDVEELKNLVQEKEVISEIGRIISSSIHIEEVYDRFSEEVRKLIPFDRIVIDIIDIEKEQVINVYMAGKGISDRSVGVVYPLQGSGNAEMVRTGSIFLLQTEEINDVRERFPSLVSTFEAGFRSIMNVPLFSRGRIVGGLLLRSLKARAYTQEHLALTREVGNQIAGTIANARLYLELKRTQDEREKLIQNLQGALVKVKTLSGLLPICASCKKIRDDRGYWTQIEAFVRDHSEAEFSHGICPECMQKLYPDLVDDIEASSQESEQLGE